MAYRLTDTNKWNDKWFLDLRPIEKLLFNYLCDNCDCAGFIEVNVRVWASQIGNNQRDVEGALKGLQKGLLYSVDSECLYIRKFLKHQKHFPLKENDNAYKGIVARFENYRERFDIKDISEFIKGASEGLRRENDNGNDNGILKDNSLKEESNVKVSSNSNITWREDFALYQSELREAWKAIITSEYITDRERYHPGLDIKMTLEKACIDFWATKAGWKNKKDSKTKEINWLSTFNKSLSNKMNQVWKEKLNKMPI